MPAEPSNPTQPCPGTPPRDGAARCTEGWPPGSCGRSPGRRSSSASTKGSRTALPAEHPGRDPGLSQIWTMLIHQAPRHPPPHAQPPPPRASTDGNCLRLTCATWTNEKKMGTRGISRGVGGSLTAGGGGVMNLVCRV